MIRDRPVTQTQCPLNRKQAKRHRRRRSEQEEITESEETGPRAVTRGCRGATPGPWALGRHCCFSVVGDCYERATRRRRSELRECMERAGIGERALAAKDIDSTRQTLGTSVHLCVET